MADAKEDIIWLCNDMYTGFNPHVDKATNSNNVSIIIVVNNFVVPPYLPHQN